MNFSRDAIEASYGYCRQMSRRAGSNFHAGFLLLPREKRRAMEALYAFMRQTDDLSDEKVGEARDGSADSVASGQWLVASTKPQAAKTQNPRPKTQSRNPEIPKSQNPSLSAWRAALEQSLRDEDTSALPPLFPALADAVRRYRIPHEHLFAVIDGVEMDLKPTNYETFEQLERYCEHVASAVGLACIHIWGFRGPEAFEPARQMGVALQLTNILRDLREDAAAGRVYLPKDDLDQCGYSIADLRAGTANESFHRLMRMEIDRAERYYRGGEALMEWLDPDSRRIFGLMTATYHQLLKQIERRPADVLRRRVRLGSFTKIKLFSRWMFFHSNSIKKV